MRIIAGAFKSVAAYLLGTLWFLWLLLNEPDSEPEVDQENIPAAPVEEGVPITNARLREAIEWERAHHWTYGNRWEDWN